MTENNSNLLVQMKDVVKAYRTGEGPFLAVFSQDAGNWRVFTDKLITAGAQCGPPYDQ
jgi:hypothetical protein